MGRRDRYSDGSNRRNRKRYEINYRSFRKEFDSESNFDDYKRRGRSDCGCGKRKSSCGCRRRSRSCSRSCSGRRYNRSNCYRGCATGWYGNYWGLGYGRGCCGLGNYGYGLGYGYGYGYYGYSGYYGLGYGYGNNWLIY